MIRPYTYIRLEMYRPCMVIKAGEKFHRLVVLCLPLESFQTKISIILRNHDISFLVNLINAHIMAITPNAIPQARYSMLILPFVMISALSV